MRTRSSYSQRSNLEPTRMHWQDAVKKSPICIALRQTSGSRLLCRYADGTGEIETLSSAQRDLTVLQMRPANVSELEGYIDWSPAQTCVVQEYKGMLVVIYYLILNKSVVIYYACHC